MPLDIVLTIAARDRPGLVERLAGVVNDNGGNWIDSSMARLGGEFAGIVRITVAEARAQGLEAALAALSSDGISVALRHNVEAPPPNGRRVVLSLTGIDHPGIVHRVSGVLAARHISIDDLETEVFTGSMTGEQLFAAKATIVVPDQVALATLRDDLERLAQDIMVDIELSGDGT